MSNSENGWAEYSKLVLKELETLTRGMELLKGDINSIKHDLVTVKNQMSHVDELNSWRRRIDDVASPSQLKEHISSLAELKAFKIKAITIFAVIQFFMGLALWLQRLT
jgi:hypothetical protein